MENKTFEPYQGVGMIYAQPGNDCTQLMVLEVGEKITCWDIWFELQIEVEPNRLWHLSEKELDSKVQHHAWGIVTVAQRLEIVQKQFLELQGQQYYLGHHLAKAAAGGTTRMEQVLQLLDGIDRCEEDNGGWWATSTGAEMGKTIIGRIKEIFTPVNYQERCPVPADIEMGDGEHTVEDCKAKFNETPNVPEHHKLLTVPDYIEDPICTIALCNELQQRGIDTSGWDGDDSPEVIIAQQVAFLLEQARKGWFLTQYRPPNGVSVVAVSLDGGEFYSGVYDTDSDKLYNDITSPTVSDRFSSYEYWAYFPSEATATPEEQMEFDYKDRVEQLDKLVSQLQQQAEGHAQEARTQASIVKEIYQYMTKAKGEPGDWNGARPVIEYMQKIEEQIEGIRQCYFGGMYDDADQMLNAIQAWAFPEDAERLANLKNKE